MKNNRAWLFIALLLNLTAAATVAGAAGPAAEIKAIRQNKTPGHFARTDKTTLKFSGYITAGTYNEYLKALTPQTRTLIVTSPGGDTNSGVKMGLDIHQRGLTVVVKGVAASSAANYLFLGGKKKVIDGGFVGFHGNAQALLAEAGGYANLKKKMKSEYKIGNADFERFKKEQEETIALEKRFFRETGVSQELFDLTQTPGKGLTKGPAREFVFLLPSPATMKKFGIRNVSGRQDVGLAEELGLSVIYY